MPQPREKSDVVKSTGPINLFHEDIAEFDFVPFCELALCFFPMRFNQSLMG
jgi:hypothetical protein